MLDSADKYIITEQVSGSTTILPSTIPEIAALGDVQKVQAEIFKSYGCWVTPQYAEALIKFVEEVTSGSRG